MSTTSKKYQKIRALHEQYKQLRQTNAVNDIILHSIVGDFTITNKVIVNKIVDLLILESLTELNKEIENE